MVDSSSGAVYSILKLVEDTSEAFVEEGGGRMYLTRDLKRSTPDDAGRAGYYRPLGRLN